MKVNKHVVLALVCMNFLLIKFFYDEYAGIWTYIFFVTIFATTLFIIYYLVSVVIDFAKKFKTKKQA